MLSIALIHAVSDQSASHWTIRTEIRLAVLNAFHYGPGIFLALS